MDHSLVLMLLTIDNDYVFRRFGSWPIEGILLSQAVFPKPLYQPLYQIDKA
jgi:hypothetical protein